MRTLVLAVVLSVWTVSGHAAFCASVGSQMSGLNRICYYSCPSGTYAVTVPNTAICPVSIDA